MSATRTRLLDAYDHQEFTYGTLLRKLPIARDASRLPLIEVQFNLEKLGANVQFDGLRTEMQSNPKAFVNTDLFLNVIETPETLILNCDYNTDLIDQSTLERWLASYAKILKGIADDAARDVREPGDSRRSPAEAGHRGLEPDHGRFRRLRADPSHV